MIIFFNAESKLIFLVQFYFINPVKLKDTNDRGI